MQKNEDQSIPLACLNKKKIISGSALVMSAIIHSTRDVL